MSNLIQDKILALAPAATVKEGEVLTVTVPAENFHAVAQMLRDDKEMQFSCVLLCWVTKWCCVRKPLIGKTRYCLPFRICGILPT